MDCSFVFYCKKKSNYKKSNKEFWCNLMRIKQENTGTDVFVDKCFYFSGRSSTVVVYHIKIHLEQHYPVYFELHI